MGVKTTVYKYNDDLAINIPRSVLPPASMEYVEQEEWVPGHPATIQEWIPLVLGALQKDGRIPMFLPPSLMGRLNLDITKPIKIRLYGEPEKWFTSHIWHRPLRDRVWIPRDTVKKLGLVPHSYGLVWLSGTTLPEKRIRMVPQMVRKFAINYFDKQYPAEQIEGDRWRLIIPKEIECYPVLLQAFLMIPPIYPLAELHRVGNIIYLDFYFYPDRARMVSEKMNYAWRSMACRNYTAAATVELAYPFLCEIRISHISSTPKRFYQIKERAVYDKEALTLKQALETSVYNLLQYFFTPAKEGYKYSSMSYAEHMGKIEYTTEKVDLQRRYPRLRNVPRITSIGEDSKEPWELTAYPYYRAIKYIRIIGKWAYKNQNFTRHIYLDEDIERVLYQNEERRVEAGLPRRIWIDEAGFIWRTYAEED